MTASRFRAEGRGGRRLGKNTAMDEIKFDPEAMGRLAGAVAFVCGADHPVATALKQASESKSERDIKKARSLFLKLKPGDRKAALTMLQD